MYLNFSTFFLFQKSNCWHARKLPFSDHLFLEFVKQFILSLFLVLEVNLGQVIWEYLNSRSPQNFTTWPQVQSLGSNLWLVYQKILMLHLCWNRTVVFSFSLTAASKWRGAILLSKGISARYLRRTHTSPHTSLCKKEKCSGDNLELLN